MMTHINNMVGGNQKHRYALEALQSSKSWTTPTAQENKQFQKYSKSHPLMTPEFKQQLKQIHQQSVRDTQQQRVMTSGFMQVPGVNAIPGVGGYLNRLGTGVSEDVTAGGIGLWNLPGQLKRDPTGTLEGMGKEMATSMYDTVRHPIRMWWDHPDQGLMNALTIASLGAGSVARGLKAADVVGQAARGDIAVGQAAKSLPGALIRTPRFERKITFGGRGGGRHFDEGGIDIHGSHKDNFVVSPQELEDNPWKRSFPVLASEDGKNIQIGAPGTDHADMIPHHKRTNLHPRQLGHDPYGGMRQGTGIIHDDGNLHVNFGEPTSVDYSKLSTDEIAKRLKKSTALGTKAAERAREKFAEAGRRGTGISVTPPAFKSTFGGLLHTRVVDPLTERWVNAAPSGGRAQVWAGRHMGKLMRRDVEMRTGMERGASEERLLQQWQDTGKLPEGIVEPTRADYAKLRAQGLKGKVMPRTFEKYREQNIRGQIQAQAYAQGAATSHANLWHSLWNGGKPARESFDHNPDAYYGVRKPPDSWSKEDIAKYSSERQVYHQYARTVERDPEKLGADPEAYTFIPKSMWNRLAPGEVSYGNLPTKILRGIDAGNQAIRAGRFIHPGYAAWAVQNGILHLSQAGMFVIRNVHQLRNELPKLNPEELAKFDGASGAGHFVGGIARATSGGAETPFKFATKRLGKFWHNVDDKIPRRLAFIHELNRMGYHSAEDWVKLMNENPRKFRSIALKGQHQAIDYAEMSPSERAILQKLFTAYGWTRGASTYTARFPFEHPVQAAGLMEMARRGKEQRDAFWDQQGGMVPDWLRGHVPFGNGAHPWVVGTGDINVGETLGQSLESIPGLVKGPEQPPSEQLGPAAQGLYEYLSGTDRFGNPLKGGEHITTPIHDILHRFTPLSYLNVFRGAKKGGGTFLEGPGQGLRNFFGIPASRLRDPKVTAALGMKDWEQSLPKPEEINFKYDRKLHDLAAQAQLFQRKNGTPMGRGYAAAIKGDIEAKRELELFQYHYAAGKGVHSFRSLPAVDKAQAAVAYLLKFRFIHPYEAADMKRQIAQDAKLNDESLMAQDANDFWQYHPIGQTLNDWESTIKSMTPHPLQPGRG